MKDTNADKWFSWMLEQDPPTREVPKAVIWRSGAVRGMNIYCACGAYGSVNTIVETMECTECGQLYAAQTSVKMFPVPEHLKEHARTLNPHLNNQFWTLCQTD